MTRIVRKENISTQDAAARQPPSNPPGDSSSPKTPSDSAMLAQRLASESSWADRYVPSTPGGTIMTPASSVADHSELAQGSEYMTPDEAPPSYEQVTNSGASEAGPGQSRALSLSSTSVSRSQPRRPFLPGRNYSRHETSQSITGSFTLYDSLDLSTTSGGIHIQLDVHPGSEPARLALKTNSGSISVHDKQADTAMSHRSISRTSSSRPSGGGLFSFLWGPRCNQVDAPPIPSSDDPRKQPGQHLIQEEETPEAPIGARIVHTTIETSSGSVSCHLVLTATSSTHIKTTSGSINVRLVTADSPASARPLSKLEAEDSRLTSQTSNLDSTFTTSSNSGSQSVHITTGRSDTSSGDLVSACKARHYSSGSSTVSCHYPREWHGLVHASVGGSGTSHVNGQGLEFDRRGTKEIWAWRGTELPDVDRAVEVRCDGSGTVNFGC